MTGVASPAQADALAHFRFHVPDAALHPDAVANALSGAPGIAGAPAVDAATDVVTVHFDAAATGPRDILAALRAAGFTPALAAGAGAAPLAADAHAARAEGAPPPLKVQSCCMTGTSLAA
jgi:hypothetical protein